MKKLVIRFNAPVVLLFALLSLLVLLLDGWTGGVSTTRFFCVYRSSLADPLTYVRFFGHVLGHSGYSHYMNNMLLLLLVGPGLEEKYGSRNLLMTILVTALVTGLVQFIFQHSCSFLKTSYCGRCRLYSGNTAQALSGIFLVFSFTKILRYERSHTTVKTNADYFLL